MYFFEHTCDTAAENIALDEALLERAERASAANEVSRSFEVLRLWELSRPAVVLGRSSQV